MKGEAIGGHSMARKISEAVCWKILAWCEMEGYWLGIPMYLQQFQQITLPETESKSWKLDALKMNFPFWGFALFSTGLFALSPQKKTPWKTKKAGSWDFHHPFEKGNSYSTMGDDISPTSLPPIKGTRNNHWSMLATEGVGPTPSHLRLYPGWILGAK